MNWLKSKSSVPQFQFAKLDDFDVTSSEQIAQWDTRASQPPKTFFRKTVILKVVGKTGIIDTPNSALIRCYLTNGMDDFTLVIWQDKIEQLYAELKLNSIVVISNLKVSPMYSPDKSKEQLWQGGEFVATKDTIVVVKKQGARCEYPTTNLYPPYWRDIKDLKQGDSEIAMRVLILNKPAKYEFKGYDNGPAMGVIFDIGDRNAHKAKCFVRVQLEDENEKEFIALLKQDTEIVLFCGSVYDNSGKVALRVGSTEYLHLETNGVLKKEKQYSSIAFSATVAPATKKRRSMFFE